MYTLEYELDGELACVFLFHPSLSYPEQVLVLSACFEGEMLPPSSPPLLELSMAGAHLDGFVLVSLNKDDATKKN